MHGDGDDDDDCGGEEVGTQGNEHEQRNEQRDEHGPDNAQPDRMRLLVSAEPHGGIAPDVEPWHDEIHEVPIG